MPRPPKLTSEPESHDSVGFLAHQGRQRVAVSIAGADWSAPATFGFLFADLARQVASLIEARSGQPRELLLARMRTLLEAEWDYPTPESPAERAVQA